MSALSKLTKDDFFDLFKDQVDVEDYRFHRYITPKGIAAGYIDGAICTLAASDKEIKQLIKRHAFDESDMFHEDGLPKLYHVDEE